MPPKNLTSVNENDFSMQRHSFSKIMVTEKKETGNVLKIKQFYGGSRNRDASAVTRNRATIGIKSSFAAKEGDLVSYKGSTDRYDIQQSLRRTRSSGAVVPPKVTHNNHDKP